MTEKLIATLRKLGLNKYEAKAYLALVSSGISSAGKLAEKSEIPRAKVYEVLKSLEKMGFVVSNNTRPSKFKAVPIEEVVKRLHYKEKNDCEKRITEITEIQGEFMGHLEELKIPEGNEVEDMVWILRGRENIYSAIDGLIEGSNKKIIGATTERGVVRKLYRHREKLGQAADRGVNIKILAPITRANIGIVRESLGKLVIRHGNSVSARFMLADDEKGVIFLVPDDNESSRFNEMGVYITSPYFITAMAHYFDHKWEKTVSLDERANQLGG